MMLLTIKKNIYIVLELKVRYYLLATQYSMLMAGFQQCFRGNLG